MQVGSLMKASMIVTVFRAVKIRVSLVGKIEERWNLPDSGA